MNTTTHKKSVTDSTDSVLSVRLLMCGCMRCIELVRARVAGTLSQLVTLEGMRKTQTGKAQRMTQEGLVWKHQGLPESDRFLDHSHRLKKSSRDNIPLYTILGNALNAAFPSRWHNSSIFCSKQML